MGVWQFIQDQVFGMKWLNELIGKGLSKLGLDVGERIGGSIQFFFYDVLKITVLLCLLIFVISYIQSYFPPERSKRILSRFHGVGANIISALLGTVTPFCSCSSIPLFIGFTSAVFTTFMSASVITVVMPMRMAHKRIRKACRSAITLSIEISVNTCATAFPESSSTAAPAEQSQPYSSVSVMYASKPFSGCFIAS